MLLSLSVLISTIEVQSLGLSAKIFFNFVY